MSENFSATHSPTLVPSWNARGIARENVHPDFKNSSYAAFSNAACFS